MNVKTINLEKGTSGYQIVFTVNGSDAEVYENWVGETVAQMGEATHCFTDAERGRGFANRRFSELRQGGYEVVACQHGGGDCVCGTQVPLSPADDLADIPGAARCMRRTLIAYAAHPRFTRLGGAIAVHDDSTSARLGQCDLIRGFAHYVGVKGGAHEGVKAVVRGGIDGLAAALAAGLRSGRDDRR